MPYYACKGAKLKCSMGSEAAATAANYGKLQEMPCIPNTMSPWLNGKMNVFVKGNPALLDCSKCLCLWAGVIEITDAGQKVISYRGQVSQEFVPASAELDEAGVAAVPGGNALASQGAGAAAGTQSKMDDGKPLFGATKTLELSGKVYSNELIFKDVLKKYALNV